MTNNIELIGIQSNKIDKSETEIIKRIIDARSQSQSKAEIIENQMIGIKFSINKYLNDSLTSEVVEAGEFLNDVANPRFCSTRLQNFFIQWEVS